jgi:hypothetical protein
MELRDRVEKLEFKMYWTHNFMWMAWLLLIGALIYLFQPYHTLELKSPSGQVVIRLKADDDMAGIWVTRGEGKPHVSMWNYRGGGVGMGVYGANTLNNMDAALASSKSGGMLQLTDPDNCMKIFTTDTLPK